MVQIPISCMNARRLISIPNLDYIAYIVLNVGSDVEIQSDGTARTPEQWLQYILDNSGANITAFDLESYEEVKISVVANVSDISFATAAAELASAIGFDTGVEYYPASLTVTGDSWGDSRLILSGVVSTLYPQEHPSIVPDVSPGFPEQSINSIVTTNGVYNDGYVRANDRDYFTIEVAWFPADKRELVRDFIEKNTPGIAEYCKITGVWRIDDSVLWQVFLVDYQGLLDGDKDGSDVRSFRIGVVVQPA